MDKVSLILPIFNRPDYTESCLKSLIKVGHGTDIQLVVVDNGSRSRTRTIISEYLDKWNASKQVESTAVCLRSETNLGFGGAVNLYLESSYAKYADYVIIMHNDVIVCDNWAGEMLEVYKELSVSDEVAVVMPRTCYANEMSVCMPEVRKEFEKVKPPNKDRMLPEEITSIVSKTYDSFGGLETFLKSISKTEPRHSYCPEIASFCMMVKADLFKTYGCFDVDFFPRGYEDKLWFTKLVREGLCSYIANRAWVMHFGNITSDGPGYCQPSIMKANSELYDAKIKELNERETRGKAK